MKLKKQIKLAQGGHSLLKRKRDGLIQEFFKVLEKAKESKSKLADNYGKALEAINLARAIDGTIAVNSAALAVQATPEFTVETKAVMGIKVPEINAEFTVKSFDQRGYGIIGTSAFIDKTAEGYEKLLQDILVAAEIETTLKKLLREIEKTKRRVNALEFIVIPSRQKEFKFIKMRLEEMEREDIFRLKRIKKKN
ncbi:MAG: V-type ATP synthase subunit D [Candidatus Diapherotrites archaeon]|nr:V-type ATP synthase subunit D [Candidatus Diapherotrites archaeon]